MQIAEHDAPRLSGLQNLGHSDGQSLRGILFNFELLASTLGKFVAL